MYNELNVNQCIQHWVTDFVLHDLFGIERIVSHGMLGHYKIRTGKGSAARVTVGSLLLSQELEGRKCI